MEHFIVDQSLHLFMLLTEVETTVRRDETSQKFLRTLPEAVETPNTTGT